MGAKGEIVSAAEQWYYANRGEQETWAETQIGMDRFAEILNWMAGFADALSARNLEAQAKELETVKEELSHHLDYEAQWKSRAESAEARLRAGEEWGAGFAEGVEAARKLTCEFCADGDPDKIKSKTLGHFYRERWYPCSAREIRALKPPAPSEATAQTQPTSGSSDPCHSIKPAQHGGVGPESSEPSRESVAAIALHPAVVEGLNREAGERVEVPSKCLSCGSDDRAWRRILPHPTEDAECFDSWHDWEAAESPEVTGDGAQPATADYERAKDIVHAEIMGVVGDREAFKTGWLVGLVATYIVPKERSAAASQPAPAPLLSLVKKWRRYADKAEAHLADVGTETENETHMRDMRMCADDLEGLLGHTEPESSCKPCRELDALNKNDTIEYWKSRAETAELKLQEFAKHLEAQPAPAETTRWVVQCKKKDEVGAWKMLSTSGLMFDSESEAQEYYMPGNPAFEYRIVKYVPSGRTVAGEVGQGKEAPDWIDTELWNFVHGLAIDLKLPPDETYSGKHDMIYRAMAGACRVYANLQTRVAEVSVPQPPAIKCETCDNRRMRCSECDRNLIPEGVPAPPPSPTKED